jgi:hypothetical protein
MYVGQITRHTINLQLNVPMDGAESTTCTFALGTCGRRLAAKNSGHWHDLV